MTETRDLVSFAGELIDAIRANPQDAALHLVRRLQAITRLVLILERVREEIHDRMDTVDGDPPGPNEWMGLWNDVGDEIDSALIAAKETITP